MRRSTILWLAAAVLAIVEIWLIATAVNKIGGLWTLLILLASALVGAWIARRQGAETLRTLRSATDPAHAEEALSSSALVMLGAFLLIVPGFLTDIVGALLVLPPTRGFAGRALNGVWRWATKDIRDRISIVEARLDRGSVVEGETVEGAAEPGRPGAYDPTGDAHRPGDRGPGGPTIIRGEIEE
ncbi:FxsA family protein [Nigerium massiliense]|uniref:FxsA family protein n=1 Tax=Nigerium massiliense TaxID=1522317 RepID=UPI0012FE1F72|nr:FxsA family protein [Nigerium massiliense]